MKKFEILNLDRLEFLKKIEKNKVQLIITSPPYNIGKDYEKKLPFKKYLEEQKKTLKECYPYYLTEHSDKTTKLFHFIGTALSIFFIIRLVITLEPINFVFALLSGYGFAWVSHFFVEKNKPATFTYPFYSLLSDYMMFWEILKGKHKIF